jgi:hypothetical protein
MLDTGFTLNVRLDWKRLIRDKHSSLFGPLVNFGSEMFYNVGPCGPFYKPSSFVNYGRNKIITLVNLREATSRDFTSLSW